MRLVYRPIITWPGTLTRQRKPSPFTATFRETLLVLDRELSFLGANEAVVQLAVAESAIRLDGTLRADRRPPEHPGVVLAFTSKQYGPLQYATDVFERGWGREADTAWRQNLRAIALGLEALRKVDRYGISRRGEQYVGWKQLGAGTPMAAASSTMTVEEAARFVAEAAGWNPGEATSVQSIDVKREAAYRLAAKRLHPDHGGSTEDFQRLQEAKTLLEAAAVVRA